jgi:pilus assembly protein Flp/PilA
MQKFVAEKFTALIVEEEGQSLVEYGLILGLVSVLLVGALQALQGSLSGIFSNVSEKLDAAANGGSKGGGKKR